MSHLREPKPITYNCDLFTLQELLTHGWPPSFGRHEISLTARQRRSPLHSLGPPGWLLPLWARGPFWGCDRIALRGQDPANDVDVVPGAGRVSPDELDPVYEGRLAQNHLAVMDCPPDGDVERPPLDR